MHQNQAASAHSPLQRLRTARKRKQSGLPVWSWFEARVTNHHQAMAGLPTKRLQDKQITSEIASVFNTPSSTRPRALYVHIPFCEAICSFCAFMRVRGKEDFQPYVDAVLRQLKSVANTAWSQIKPFEAVYFGGGTPTCLSTEQLVMLVSTIRESFPLSPTCEFTIEGRFSGLDTEKIAALQQAGVSRMSLGVQTFDTKRRQSLGRLCSGDEVIQFIGEAGKSGSLSINLDLLYALPGQTPDQWIDDLQTAIHSGATGCSTYPLIPFPKSPLMKSIEAGKQAPLPSLEEEYALFQVIADVLDHSPTWQRMSSFHIGDPRSETVKYNSARLGQWDILGLGSGAGGSIHNVSYMNPLNIEQYQSGAGKAPIVAQFASIRSDEVSKQMHWYSLFSSSGITQSDIDNAPREIVSFCELLYELNFVETDGRKLRLTATGHFWVYTLQALLSDLIGSLVKDNQLNHVA